MAQQIIDIGQSPNDGTGDTIRESYNKTNENFTELYAGAPARTGSTVTFDLPVIIHGTKDIPLTGDITLSDVDLFQGSTVFIYHKQATAPNIILGNLEIGSDVIGGYIENATPVLNAIILLYTSDGFVEITYRNNIVAPSLSQTDWVTGTWEAPADKLYTLILNAPYGGTITKTTSQSISGTGTATFSINGVAISGTANAVSSTEVEQVHVDTFVAGDNIEVTINANADLVDMSLTVEFNYTLQ